MATFHLKVLTVDKQFFDGEVDRIVVRTSQGDVGILPNHVPYVAALGVGGLTIIRNGERRVAGGFGRFCGCFGRADGRAGAYLRVGRRNRRGPVPVRPQTVRKRFCRKRPATVKWISHRAS